MEIQLTSGQRADLKGRAQNLKSIIHIGKNGLTEQVFVEINRALKTQELIKIKFIGERNEIETMTHEIAEKTGSQFIGGVGKTSIFYKENPALHVKVEEKRKPTIKKTLKKKKRR